MKRGRGNAAEVLPELKPGFTGNAVSPYLTVVSWQGAPALETPAPVVEDSSVESEEVSRTQPGGRPEGVSDQALKDAWLAVHCSATAVKTTRVKRVVEPGIECKVRKKGDTTQLPVAALAPWAVSAPPGVSAISVGKMISGYESSSASRTDVGRGDNVVDMIDPRAVEYVLSQHRERVQVYRDVVKAMATVAEIHDKDYDFGGSVERRKLERADNPDQVDVTGVDWNTEARLVPANDSSYHRGAAVNTYFTEPKPDVLDQLREKRWRAHRQFELDLAFNGTVGVKHNLNTLFTEDVKAVSAMQAIASRQYAKRLAELTEVFSVVPVAKETVVNHPQVPASLFPDARAIERDMLDYKLGNYLRYYSRAEFLKDFATNVEWCVDIAPSNVRAAVFNSRCQERRRKLQGIASRNRKPQPMSVCKNRDEFWALFRGETPVRKPTVDEMTAEAGCRILDNIIAQCNAAKAELEKMSDDALIALSTVKFSPAPATGLLLPDVDEAVRKELGIEEKFNLGGVKVEALPVL